MTRPWWKEAIVYEIYCKSFCDTNGDGIGDLKGVMSKLPVLKELGINCIWFAPIYTSPQVDNGYDVADYYDIDPAYGTIEDFKNLVDMAHSLGIRIIMDMVLNHSSDECKWFIESRKSKDNPYRNYYIWQPPKNGKEPNNWGGYFREGNGSAWEFDETTGEYYLHQYSIKMPDLNWEYKPLRQEIYKMLNWWLDLGVDGFRLDIYTRFKKPDGFPDTKKAPNPLLDKNGFIVDPSMCTNVEGIHEILHELYTEVFGPRNCMTVGEGAGVIHDNALSYVKAENQEIDMVYHFQLANRSKYSISTEHFCMTQKNWYNEVIKENGWAVQYMSNHDSARQVSCYGNDSNELRKPSAKLLATLLHTTPGTPFVYQGEEIGMTNVKYDTIEDYNCCYTVGDYHAMIKSGVSPKEAIDTLAPKSRDNARTPYQWSDGKNAGFTSGKPWIKVNPRFKEINLENDLNSPDSIFRYYRKLSDMRKDCPAIIDGDLNFLAEGNEKIICYTRACKEQTLLIVANYCATETEYSLPENVKNLKWKRLLTNYDDTSAFIEDNRALKPYEVEVYELV